MFGKKLTLEEGAYVFSTKKNGNYYDFIFGVVTGVDDRKVGITGVIVNPVGLKNKIEQGKTGERSEEILEHPTPDNVVLALVYRIEYEKWLHQWIINKPEVIDFLQTHLPLNDFKTKGLKHDVLAYAYEFPVKSTLGSGEIPHYFQEDYQKIIEYSEREFIYPELYEKIITKGMITKETLLKSIKHYELQKLQQE